MEHPVFFLRPLLDGSFPGRPFRDSRDSGPVAFSTTLPLPLFPPALLRYRLFRKDFLLFFRSKSTSSFPRTYPKWTRCPYSPRHFFSSISFPPSPGRPRWALNTIVRLEWSFNQSFPFLRFPRWYDDSPSKFKNAVRSSFSIFPFLP